MNRRHDRLISELACTVVSDRACNQYSKLDGDLAANAVRRRNLRLYLEELERISPKMLLVGEAPSYRGGRLTGIAFVSETVLLAGVDIQSHPGHILGSSHGYRRATPGPRLSTEASATMVWSTIRTIDPLPMLWNAFPFHPFHRGTPDTNRMPDSGELALGRQFIEMLLDLFPISEIVAVGNHAAASMTKLGLEHTKIRHPSMGGKNEFVAGMARLSQRTVAEAIPGRSHEGKPQRTQSSQRDTE
jgi:uracil-DNA glycosylase